MRTIFAFALGLVLAGSVYAQKPVVICAPIYAEWGSSRIDIIQACNKAKLTIYEINPENEDGISSVTYLDGAVARIFTLMHGKYVSFTLLNMNQSAAERSKFLADQLEEFALLTSTMEDDKWIVTCAKHQLKVGLAAKKDQVTLTVNNQTVLAEIARSKN